MSKYYTAGGSEYITGDSADIWFGVDINGHATGLQDSFGIDDFETDDPFFWMGNKGSEASPNPKLMLGLTGSSMMEFTESGVHIGSAISEANAFSVGNGVDMFKMFIVGGVPRIKINDGDRFYVESDGDTYIVIDLFDGTYRSRILHNKTNQNFNIDSDGILNLQAASDIVMKTNSTGRWKIDGTDGHFIPISDDAFTVGSNTLRVAEVYHCGLTAGTCADFSKFSLEELINIISYQPLTGTYEKMKNGSLLPHIDMKSIHPLLSDVYQGHEEEIEKENGKIEKIKKTSFQTKNLFDKDGKSKSVEYLKNDGCGIDFENLVYALVEIVKKQNEEIKQLKKK